MAQAMAQACIAGTTRDSTRAYLAVLAQGWRKDGASLAQALHHGRVLERQQDGKRQRQQGSKFFFVRIAASGLGARRRKVGARFGARGFRR